MTSILDSVSNLSLLISVDARDATRENFALIVSKTRQKVRIEIINDF